MTDTVEKYSWTGPIVAIILGLSLIAMIVLSVLFGPGAIYPETRIANVTWSEVDYSTVSGIPHGTVISTDAGSYYLPSSYLNGEHWVAFPPGSSWSSLPDSSFSDDIHVVKYNIPYKITIWHSVFGGYTTDVGSTWKTMPRISSMEEA